MKILMFAPSRSIHTHKWATYLKSHGIEIVVATFQNHYSEDNAQEVRTISLPKKLPGKLSYLPAIFDLRKVLQEEKPDLLHAHYASSYGFIASWLDFHPTIVSVWGSDIYEFPKRNALSKYIVKKSLQRADVICSTSHAMAEEAAKYTSKPLEITPFGVDTKLFCPAEPIPKKIFRIGIAKGLKQIYGYHELLQGFSIFSQKHPQTELWIIGDGEERPRYEQIANQLGIQHKVKFLGHRANTEIPKLLHQLDVFILPSHQDSFGVAALEAQACGVPVIVNRVGGLPEVVREQETGWIMESNHPDEIVKALEWMWKNPERRVEMGKKAVSFVQENYSWEETGKRMKRLYQKILSK